MKKTILFLSLITGLFGYSQFLPIGTSTTDNKVRVGGIGLGYTPFNVPTFGNSKLLVNGDGVFNGKLGVGNYSLGETPQEVVHIRQGKLMIGDYFEHYENGFNFAIKSEGGIVIKPKPEWTSGATIEIVREQSFIQMAIASCDYCYSNNSVEGDLVLRGYSSGNNSKSLIIANEGTGKIKFATRETPSTNGGITQVRMTIDNTGKVGIGTENPDAELAVNGLIHAKEVKVDLQGWPDYVFSEKYDLISLEEVEKHINEKGHLPNIPSAKEVEENGVNLGEMNKKLLEKVEELTLYVIDLKKELELLKNKK